MLKPFFRFASEGRQGTPARKWDPATIEEYRAHLHRLGLAASTVSSYLVLVRKFFAWAAEKKLYPNIAKGVKGEKREPGFRQGILTVDAVREILKAMEPRKPLESRHLQKHRDFAIVNLMVRTGVRAVELCRADIGDISKNSKKRVLRLRRGPGGAFVVLTQEAWRPLCTYLALRHTVRNRSPLFASVSDRNADDRLTPRSVSGIVKAAFRAQGMDAARLTATSLRHTAITLALQAGATLAEAQAMARHASIRTTMEYARPAPGAAEGKVSKALK